MTDMSLYREVNIGNSPLTKLSQANTIPTPTEISTSSFSRRDPIPNLLYTSYLKTNVSGLNKLTF